MMVRCSKSFAVALLAFSWLQSASAAQLTLGSGKSVDVLSVGPLYLQSGPPGLMVQFRTDLPLSDLPRLRREADQVWNYFVAETERRGYEFAAIQAQEPFTGAVIKSGDAFSFVYEKKGGLWRTIEFSKDETPKLTKDLIEDLMGRITQHYTSGATDAFVLYLGDRYETTLIDKSGNGLAPRTYDREAFSKMIVFGRATSQRYSFEITDITIQEDGRRATVTGREAEVQIINGRSIETSGTTQHIIELADRSAVIARTIAYIELVIRSSAR